MTRCGLSVGEEPCPRPLGHDGECRATWHAFARCDQWMPNAKARCARRRGHRWEHQSSYSLETRRTNRTDVRFAITRGIIGVAGTSSSSGTIAIDAAPLLVPECAASLRSEGRD